MARFAVRPQLPPVVASSAYISFHPVTYMMPSCTTGVDCSARGLLAIGNTHAAPSR